MNETRPADFDPDELVTIYTAREPTLAELVRSELEAEGIRSEVSGENQGGLAGVLRIEVLVRAQDAERARAFIQSHEKLGGGSDLDQP